MLLITRRAGERIVLGDEVIIEVMEISGTHVRVGIHAPRSVPIYREEIWEAVREEKAAAAKAGDLPEGLSAARRDPADG